MKKQALLALGLTLAFTPAVIGAEIATKESTTGDIYLTGLSSYQSIVVEYSAIPKTSKKTANECGFIKLTSSTSAPLNLTSDSITYNSTNYTLNTVPVSTALTCSNGAVGGTVSAMVQKDGNAVYITGLTPYSTHTIGYNNLPVSRSAKANTCGIVRLSNTDQYDNSVGDIVIKDKDTNTVLGTLPAFATIPVGGGPICKQGQGFYPTGYPSTANF